MENSNETDRGTTKFSPARLLLTLLGVFFIAAVAYWYGANSVELPIPNEGRSLKNFGLAERVDNRLDEQFTDADENGVADPPTETTAWIDPDVLFFSYGSEQQAYHSTEDVWVDLLKFLTEKTGKPVQFVAIQTPREQLAALAERRLHVVGTNPGSVPLLVNTCGFVPVCAAGKDGNQRPYKMEIIVPANSPAGKPEDLRGRMLTLTDPSSNSGWKAPLVILMEDFGFQPMRDYLTNYSGSHIASIKGIAAGDYQAAAVADTEVMLAAERGDISADQVKVIYQSQPFPYDCLGHVHNLNPELAGKIRAALLDFDWSETSLEQEFQPLGLTEYVELTYPDDLALVIEIDNATGHKHTLETAFQAVPER